MAAFADVAVAVAIRKSFAYAIPAPLRSRAAVGMRALVPFGRKVLTGFIVRVSDEPPTGAFRLRPIRDLLDPEAVLPASLVETALWIAQRYFSPPGEVLKALFPAGTQVSGVRRIRIRPRIAQLLGGGLRPPGLRPAEILVLEALAAAGSLTEAELSSRGEVADLGRCIDALAAASLVDIEVEVARARVDAREQLAIAALRAPESEIPRLSPVQRRLYDFLLGRDGPVLLQEAIRAAGCSPSVPKALESRGLAQDLCGAGRAPPSRPERGPGAQAHRPDRSAGAGAGGTARDDRRTSAAALPFARRHRKRQDGDIPAAHRRRAPVRGAGAAARARRSG